MGPDSGTRNNRYCRRRGDLYGLGNVGTQEGSTLIRIDSLSRAISAD